MAKTRKFGSLLSFFEKKQKTAASQVFHFKTILVLFEVSGQIKQKISF